MEAGNEKLVQFFVLVLVPPYSSSLEKDVICNCIESDKVFDPNLDDNLKVLDQARGLREKKHNQQQKQPKRITVCISFVPSFAGVRYSFLKTNKRQKRRHRVGVYYFLLKQRCDEASDETRKEKLRLFCAKRDARKRDPFLVLYSYAHFLVNESLKLLVTVIRLCGETVIRNCESFRMFEIFSTRERKLIKLEIKLKFPADSV